MFNIGICVAEVEALKLFPSILPANDAIISLSCIHETAQKLPTRLPFNCRLLFNISPVRDHLETDLS